MDNNKRKLLYEYFLSKNYTKEKCLLLLQTTKCRIMMDGNYLVEYSDGTKETLCVRYQKVFYTMWKKILKKILKNLTFKNIVTNIVSS